MAFGLIETRLTEPKTDASMIEIAGRRVQAGIPAQQLELMARMIPLGRGGTPREGAGGIVFLCSPWSDYVTGQVLSVSGGIPLGMSA